MTNVHPELPFLFLSLGLCVFFAWLMRYRLRTLIPETSLRLATLFLSIQILLIVINIIRTWNGTDIIRVSLWGLTSESSFPSALSTLQLSLLSCLCFSIVFSSAYLSRVERAYWLVPGMGTAIMTLLEYEHRLIPESFLTSSFQVPAGILLTSATVARIRHYRGGSRRTFLLFLLIGLWIWALGALALDEVEDYCVIFRAFGDLCLSTSPLEETLEFLGILVALTGVAGYASEILTPARTQRLVFLSSVVLVALLLGALVRDRDWNYVEIRFLGKHYGRKISVDFADSALALRGWSSSSFSPGNYAPVDFWLHATRPLQDDFGFTVQLLDQESMAVVLTKNKRSDTPASQWQPGIRYSVFQKVLLFLPESIPTDRALWLTLSFWKTDENDFVSLPVDYSDYPLLGDTHVILDELVLPQPAQRASQGEAPGKFANGFVLQNASIPERAQAGAEMDVTFAWGTENNGSEDWIQFLHLVHEDSGALWNVDQMPLGLRLPTRLWYEGLRSSEVWQFTLPADLQAGRYAIYSGLYRLSDLQRLGVTLADGTQPVDARIPLGIILIEG